MSAGTLRAPPLASASIAAFRRRESAWSATASTSRSGSTISAAPAMARARSAAIAGAQRLEQRGGQRLGTLLALALSPSGVGRVRLAHVPAPARIGLGEQTLDELDERLWRERLPEVGARAGFEAALVVVLAPFGRDDDDPGGGDFVGRPGNGPGTRAHP